MEVDGRGDVVTVRTDKRWVATPPISRFERARGGGGRWTVGGGDEVMEGGFEVVVACVCSIIELMEVVAMVMAT